MTHAVASKPQVVVGRVVDRLDPEVGAQLAGFAASDGPQRSTAGVVAGEAVEARTAEQVEEHGLGLVIGGMPGEHLAGQGVVASPPGTGFQVRTWGDVDRDGTELGPSLPGHRRDEIGFGGGVGTEAVVDVHGGDLAASLDRQHQQRDRVGTSGHRAGERRARWRERATGQQVRRRGHHSDPRRREARAESDVIAALGRDFRRGGGGGAPTHRRRRPCDRRGAGSRTRWSGSSPARPLPRSPTVRRSARSRAPAASV